MVRKLIFLLGAALGIGLAPRVMPAAVEPPLFAHIDDPGRLVTADTSWASAADASLAAFERSSGIRILVQFHVKPPPEEEDRQPGNYMRGLATRLGVIKKGVLVVHFAGDPDWRVWVGDELTPVFVGKPGTAKEFTESGAMHDAKEAFLGASMAKAAGQLAELKKSFGPDRPLPPGKLLTLQADALIEGLYAKLGRVPQL